MSSKNKEANENNEQKNAKDGSQSEGQKQDENKKLFFPLPLALAGGLCLMYLILSSSFNSAIDARLISIPDTNKTRNIANANQFLNKNTGGNQNASPTPSPSQTPKANDSENKKTNPPSDETGNQDAANINKNVEKLEADVNKLVLSNLARRVDKLSKQVASLTEAEDQENEGDENSDTASGETNKEKNNANKASSTSGKSVGSKEKQLRASLSKRYSSRMMWVFLTALLCALTIAIIWFTYFVMKEAEVAKYGWFGLTSVVALVVLVIAYFAGEIYMPVAGQMFDDTLFNNEERLGKTTFGFFNAVVFSAIVFLVAASCTIYFKVRLLNEETQDEIRDKKKLEAERGKIEETLSVDPENAALKTNLENITAALQEIEVELTKYQHWHLYLRGLLFFGGALLAGGLLLISTLFGWHQAFVTADSFPLLKDFFDSNIKSLAVFYTILLGMIYLPVSFTFPDTIDSPSMDKSLKEGLWTTIIRFAPQILAILSPALVASLSTLLSALFGGQSD